VVWQQCDRVTWHPAHLEVLPYVRCSTSVPL
jgi:hypothetical protein